MDFNAEMSKWPQTWNNLLISVAISRLTGWDEPDEPGCAKVTATSQVAPSFQVAPSSPSPLLSICSSTCELCLPWDAEAVSNHLFFSCWFFSVTVHRRLSMSTADESRSSLVLICSPPQSIGKPARLPSNRHMNHFTPFTNCCCILPPSYASGAEPLALAFLLFVDT